MGYSPWIHLDFDEITGESQDAFRVRLSKGPVVIIPKRVVADRKDYRAGDRNGVISVREKYAIRAGLC